MKGLILFPLTVLFVFMFINTLGGGLTLTNTQDLNSNGTIATNGTVNLVNIPIGSFAFTINATQGAILILVTIITIGAIAGIRAVGTGIANISIEIITKGAFYFALWGILSAFAQPLIAEIPLVGTLIYLALTIMYIIGFVQGIGGGASSDD